MGKQLDFYQDFLEPQWNDADMDISIIETRIPENVIAYSPLFHHLHTDSIMSYFLIVKDESGRNPYHLGSTNKDFTRFNKEPMPRDFQLSSAKLWTLNWIVERQRGRWFWKSNADKTEFENWYHKKFVKDDCDEDRMDEI